MPSRLQVSLIETSRAGGRVRNTHIASLRSIATPLTTANRITFWHRLHERLARLGNRLNPEDQRKILGAIHAKVPMVTAEEQRTLQSDNANSDAEFWDRLHTMNAETAADHKGLAERASQAAQAMETAAADAKAKADTARDRLARIERGENVDGGLGKTLTDDDFKRIMREAGMTKADIRHSENVGKIYEAGCGEWFFRELMASKDRAEKRTVREFVKVNESFNSLPEEAQVRVIAAMKGGEEAS